jgi:hypothetical protein
MCVDILAVIGTYSCLEAPNQSHLSLDVEYSLLQPCYGTEPLRRPRLECDFNLQFLSAYPSDAFSNLELWHNLRHMK